eukprot:TRINITY_DN2906_c0_g4_i1.p1 TRINITY_DN2906_c0_g4~~TRINITY_DN2906_c0_g4_i1.p1  ORF type:complete len:872 (+),score=109.39 TRINITY_DN2906_c0_g4_i1:49-2664(+)
MTRPLPKSRLGPQNVSARVQTRRASTPSNTATPSRPAADAPGRSRPGHLNDSPILKNSLAERTDVRVQWGEGPTPPPPPPQPQHYSIATPGSARPSARRDVQVPSPPLEKFHAAASPPSRASLGAAKGRGRGRGGTLASSQSAGHLTGARGGYPGRGAGRGGASARQSSNGGEQRSSGLGALGTYPSRIPTKQVPKPEIDVDLERAKGRIRHGLRSREADGTVSLDMIAHANDGTVAPQEIKKVVRKQLCLTHDEVTDRQLNTLIHAHADENGNVKLDKFLDDNMEKQGIYAIKSEGGRTHLSRTHEMAPAHQYERSRSGTRLASGRRGALVHADVKEREDFKGRMDILQWQRCAEMGHHGGYYKSGAQSQRDMEKKDLDERLLGAISSPGSPPHTRSLQLRARSASAEPRSTGERAGNEDAPNENLTLAEPPSSMGNSSRRTASPMPVSMSAAFTDRSVRLRDEKYSRSNIGHFGDLGNGATLQSPTPGHVDCKCPVCRPFEAPAAGQCSSMVQSNRPTRFNGHALRQQFKQDSAEYGQAQLPTAMKPDGVDGASDVGSNGQVARHAFLSSHPMDSRQMKTEMAHSYFDDQGHNKQQELFAKNLGRKSRLVPPHRSHSVDSLWDGSAGGYRMVSPNSLRVGIGSSPDSRGNIVPGLTKKADMTADPIVTATPNGANHRMALKGRGEFKDGCSEHTAKLNANRSGTTMRYDGDRPVSRTASVPPHLMRSGWDPLTHEGDAHAALQQQLAHVRDSDPQKDCVSEMESSSNYAGVSSAKVAERKFKRWIGPPVNSRLLAHQDNSAMEQVISNVAVREASVERQQRLATDARFAATCETVARVRDETAIAAEVNKARRGHTSSHQIRDTLIWDA